MCVFFAAMLQKKNLKIRFFDKLYIYIYIYIYLTE